MRGSIQIGTGADGFKEILSNITRYHAHQMIRRIGGIVSSILIRAHTHTEEVMDLTERL